ncbi:fumarylacetoacetate hydrolase family protein, partial [mine drainage metagenome]
GRDGTLIVVSRDLVRAVRATGIAPTLQAALDDWQRVAPLLNALSERLDRTDPFPNSAAAGRAAEPFALDMGALAAP